MNSIVLFLILDGFHGDVYVLVKLLLPGVSKRIYNLQSKQIVKLLSQVFQCSVDDMIGDLDQVSCPCAGMVTIIIEIRAMSLKLLKSFSSKAKLVHLVRLVLLPCKRSVCLSVCLSDCVCVCACVHV